MIQRIAKTFTLISLAALFCFVFAGEGFAATYYVAPNGSDSSVGSSTAPWATFTRALSALKPGDTLMLKNGTYRQALTVLVSGIQGNPITIKAENDGGATIDGEDVRAACYVGTSDTSVPRIHDIVMEGMRCQNSKYSAFSVVNADRVMVKRVSAYNGASGNNHVFETWFASYVTFEDTAASGRGRIMYNISGTPHTTLRRCWGRWSTYNTIDAPYGIVQIYGSDDSLVENCIGTSVPGAPYALDGIYIWAHTYNPSANRNSVYGSVVYGLSTGFATDNATNKITSNKFINNVSINNSSAGLLQKADNNLIVQNFTALGSGSGYTIINSYPNTGNSPIKVTLSNSNIFSNRSTGINKGPASTVVANSYNNVAGNGTNYYGLSAGTGEVSLSPLYDTAKYGKGAYLLYPSNLKGLGANGANIGSEVLYRYQDGVLTTVPLWPWPMEDRIFRETGISVTWEANGGIWKTLDGVYSGATTPTDPTDSTPTDPTDPATPPPTDGGSATPSSDTTAPSIPGAISGSALSTTEIKLTWSAASDPTISGQTTSGVGGYAIYRNGTQFAITSLTEHTDKGLQAGTTYKYTVQAIDNAWNRSAQSAPISVATKSAADTTAPSVPTGLAGSAVSTSEVKLTWAASTDPTISGQTTSGVGGYLIYRNGTQIATTSATSFSNTGLSAGTSYTYTIAAVDSTGNKSAQSAPVSVSTKSTTTADTTAPSVPAGLSGTAVSTSEVALSWSASTDPAISGQVSSGTGGYRVYRNGVQIAITSLTTHTDKGLTAGTTYRYTVAALDNAWNTSAQSAPVSVATKSAVTSAPDTTAPSVPTKLSGKGISTSEVALSWAASTDPAVSGQTTSGVGGYRVYRNGVVVATTSLLTYTDKGLAAGTTYVYNVKALDNAGNTSGYSSAALGSTKWKR